MYEVAAVDVHGLHFAGVFVAVQEAIDVRIGFIKTIALNSGIVGRAAIAARTSLSGTPLRARARRVGTSVLAMCNAKVGVLRFGLDAFNGLDGVRNVCEVDESTVPTREFRILF